MKQRKPARVTQQIRRQRAVKAHLDRNGVIIFRLLEGSKETRTFGYGTQHKVWLNIEQVSPSATAVSATKRHIVKEQIAQWMR